MVTKYYTKSANKEWPLAAKKKRHKNDKEKESFLYQYSTFNDTKYLKNILYLRHGMEQWKTLMSSSQDAPLHEYSQ